MSKFKKTNAMRILEKNEIEFSCLYYDCDGENFDGVLVSQQVGLPPNQVFKTLVTKSENEYIVCVIPVDKKLDLKALALAAGVKKLDMIPVNDILKVTGYIRGGCSPVGMKKDYPTFIDSSALEQSKISVSAGIRGTQMLLNPNDLIRVCKITAGEFTF